MNTRNFLAAIVATSMVALPGSLLAQTATATTETETLGYLEIGDDAIIARREIDGGFEVYELPRPAVLGVKEGLNLPRYPTMKGRLASKKVEIGTVGASADAGGQARLRLHRPEEALSETVILGTGPEAAAAVVDVLDELGVL